MTLPAGYRVTEDGRVFSPYCNNRRNLGETELSRRPGPGGYLRIRIVIGDEKKRVNFAVHQLVAEAFLSPRPSPQHEIRHLNGNRTDNRVDNLAWGTAKENAADRERHGRTARGASHGMTRLHCRCGRDYERFRNGRKFCRVCRDARMRRWIERVGRTRGGRKVEVIALARMSSGVDVDTVIHVRRRVE